MGKTLGQRLLEQMRSCRLCPRSCGVNRLEAASGFCKSDAGLNIAAITLHRGEEPVLSGPRGMCNVFFAHCNLRCSYCQNHQISRDKPVIALAGLDLQQAVAQIASVLARGVSRLGFVSPSHMVAQMVAIVEALWREGLRPVIVYNSSGYDRVETLRLLEGLVDVYLPDCKYMDAELARQFSAASDYPQVATAALREMYRQMGNVLHRDDAGLALRGMIVRHLVLPGKVENSLNVLRFLARELSPKLALSLMSQYYPTAAVAGHPELGRGLQAREYETVLREMEALGLQNGFVQALESAECYRPDFAKGRWMVRG